MSEPEKGEAQRLAISPQFACFPPQISDYIPILGEKFTGRERDRCANTHSMTVPFLVNRFYKHETFPELALCVLTVQYNATMHLAVYMYMYVGIRFKVLLENPRIPCTTSGFHKA